MLKDNEKLSIVFDTSKDQIDKFPNDYYIAVVLEFTNDWVNTGYVYHVAELKELDNLLKERNANK